MKISAGSRSIPLFLCSAAWFSLLISWRGFIDPDAFYHAHMSWLVWQNGPLRAFPWLDLTLWGKSFADLHFAFHAFVAPFTALFGEFQGLRIASVTLAAAFVAVFEACLRWLKIRNPLVWTGLLLVSYPFLIRALAGKATPLALIWFLLGLAAAWKRKPWLVGLAALAYALSHAGWVYLAGSIVLLAFGDALYDKIIGEKRLTDVIRGSRWMEVAAAFAGGIAGMVVHPNFPNTFTLTWAVVVRIGLGTPWKHVVLGAEWLPTDPSGFLASFAPWFILILFGLAGLLFATRKPLDEDRARLLVSVGWVWAVLTALTLKSRRNVEYLAPIIALWTATLWSLVDARRLLDSFRQSLRTMSRPMRAGLPWFLAASFAVLIAKQVWDVRTSLNPPTYLDDAWRDTISEISKRARPGDRVFHTDWDEFPILFAADDRLKYVFGLDPTLLYLADPALSDKVRDTAWDVTTSTTWDEAWELIHDRLGARFIFVTKQSHQKFLKLVQEDPRYVRIADATDTAAFEVTQSNVILSPAVGGTKDLPEISRRFFPRPMPGSE